MSIDTVAGIENEVAEEVVQQEEVQQSSGFGIDLSILKAPTGEGSIDSYLDHPLNWKRSMGLAQVIRGLTGLLGEINSWLIDVVMGGMRFKSEMDSRVRTVD